MAIGACTGVGGNITTDAFGVVALVALAPIIAIQATGLLYVYKSKRPVETEVPEDTDYARLSNWRRSKHGGAKARLYIENAGDYYGYAYGKKSIKILDDFQVPVRYQFRGKVPPIRIS